MVFFPRLGFKHRNRPRHQHRPLVIHTYIGKNIKRSEKSKTALELVPKRIWTLIGEKEVIDAAQHDMITYYEHLVVFYEKDILLFFL
jgi:hypothetical protein